MSASPDSATRSGEILLNLRLTEPWIGITWAYPFNDKIGFGVTQYIAIRSHRGRFQTTLQVDDTLGQTALNLLRDFRYYNVRLLWKVGLIYQLDNLTLGLTVTTPSLNLFGSGRLYLNSSLTDNSGLFESDLDAFYQDDLSTTYKSPLSIAVGASYSFETTRVYFTSEWFNKFEQFNIFNAEGLSYKFGDKVIPVQLTHQLNSVINFGVGIQHRFNPDLGTYFGFNTDFSAVQDDSTSNIAIATWDIYHFTIGASFTLYEIDLNIGVGYGFSNRVVSEILNIGNAEPINSDANIPSTEAKYQRFKLILGLSL
jgi:hypothetical protein